MRRGVSRDSPWNQTGMFLPTGRETPLIVQRDGPCVPQPRLHWPNAQHLGHATPLGGMSHRAASALYSAEIWALWVVNDTCFLFWQKQDLTLARTCRWAAWFPLLSDFSQGRSHCAMPVLGKHGLTCGSPSLCTPKLAPRLPWNHPWARTHV